MFPLQIISTPSLGVSTLGDGWLSITFPGITAFGMSISPCTAVAPQGRPEVVEVYCTNWIWNLVNETGSTSIFHWASILKMTKSCRDLVKENDLMLRCFPWILVLTRKHALLFCCKECTLRRHTHTHTIYVSGLRKNPKHQLFLWSANQPAFLIFFPATITLLQSDTVFRCRKGPEPFLYLPGEEPSVNETTQRAVKTAWPRLLRQIAFQILRLWKMKMVK